MKNKTGSWRSLFSVVLLSIVLLFGCKKEIVDIEIRVPELSTSAGTNIKTTTATLGGVISSDGGILVPQLRTSVGGSPVTVRGICWNTAANPKIDNHKIISGSGTGPFLLQITGLTSGTKYYIKAFATNSAGTGYGNEINFTTLNGPTLTTTEVTNILQTSAVSGGSITSDGGSSVISRGICWSITQNPTARLATKTKDGPGIGVFASNLTGLTPNSTYFLKAYAATSSDTSYGNQITFTTIPIVIATISTTNAGNITQTTVQSGGNITSDGGANIISKGVCWSTVQNPTVALSTKTIDGTGTGSYVSNISGLTPGTTYYIRAYATNGLGTGYGSQVSFTTTAATIPVLTTTAISSLTQTTASSGGNITSNGGSALLASGVCWSTTSNPTVVLTTKTSNGTVVGIFISSITLLTPGTVYYLRAYATNSIGTAYGSQISFTTSVANLASVTTASASLSTMTTAIAGGTVVNDGGAAVTIRGVCWNTSSNPTVSNSKTSDATGTGSFTSSVTALALNTTYYIRAYATNSIGTAYGAQVTLKTGVGGSYQGGIIAYILVSGDPGYSASVMHGFIAATSDQSAGIRWYNGTNINTTAIATSLGTGNANTNTIVTKQGTGSYAAKLCYDLVSGGYSDWYLPSRDELDKLYLNRAAIGGFSTNYYWCSSEYSLTNALLQLFTTPGTQATTAKYATYPVRAIRSF